jgi:1-deoxy-D-xylulose-5-phosphate reductoisomerase
LKEGGTMSAVLNAANEVAVNAFLERKIGFRDIHRIIDKTMQGHVPRRPKQVDEILEVDRWARERALSLIH